MKKMALLLVVMFLLGGCAAQGVTTLGTFDTADGSSVAYVRAWWRAPMDIDGSVVDRYQTRSGKSELIAHDAGFEGGWGKKTVSMAVPAAIMGGSYMGGSALIRPSNISQVGGGASQAQDATARQFQGQQQKQKQSQGQSQELTNKPVTANINTNVNDNKATGGAGGSATIQKGAIVNDVF